MPLFIRRPQQAQIVEAEQVGAGSQAHPQGARPARPGDWLVTDHATAQQMVLTPEEFAAQYEVAPIPQHLVPAQGQAGPEAQDQPEGDFPEREPVDQPQSPDLGHESGDRAPMDQPIREQLPGRQPTTGEFRPRVESSAPVESPTGLPEQPGDADKAFHERDQAPAGLIGPPAPNPDQPPV